MDVHHDLSEIGLYGRASLSTCACHHATSFLSIFALLSDALRMTVRGSRKLLLFLANNLLLLIVVVIRSSPTLRKIIKWSKLMMTRIDDTNNKSTKRAECLHLPYFFLAIVHVIINKAHLASRFVSNNGVLVFISEWEVISHLSVLLL